MTTSGDIFTDSAGLDFSIQTILDVSSMYTLGEYKLIWWMQSESVLKYPW